MTEEPRLPHRLKRGDRTAARVGEAEYPVGIRAAGYTGPKDGITVEVHEGAADGAGARQLPEDSGHGGPGGRDVFMKKPRAGACCRYIKLKKKHRA